MRNISKDKKPDLDTVNRILKTHKDGHGEIIEILQDIQAYFNYLPRKALQLVARKKKIPLSRIYHVATFYSAFSLTPRGKYTISVCTGTACHVRGGSKILDTVEDALEIKAGNTTCDTKFTLSGVNCLGCCAQGPMLMVDSDYYGGVTPTRVKGILEKYE